LLDSWLVSCYKPEQIPGGAKVSTQAKLQPDPLELLKINLEDAPRSYGFLSEYVKSLEWHQHEEDIFIHHAFENATSGGAYSHREGRPVITSVFSELYEPLDAEHKLEIRHWWHEMVRRKANQFTDLRARLSKLT
jgi:hypothetical protein